LPNDSELLLTRLAYRFAEEARPLALVVGAGLSQEAGRGVAGVREILRTGLAQHSELDEDQSYLRALESSAVDLGDLYRGFMGRLVKARGRPAADALVRHAVLQAWQHTNEPSGDGLGQADLDGWQLTSGLVALASIVKGRKSAFSTIVTTNFDPLIEVALRREGVETRRRVITADSTLHVAAAEPHSGVEVVYVHGFWHKSPTMHTAEQLMYSRPRLQSALVATLKRHDVLVVGYGGWDDVITGALEALTFDDGASTEVLWAFYEEDPVVLQARNRTLLGRVGRLIIEGLFHQYIGIDCHKALPDLARRLESSSPPDTSITVGTVPSGWVVVDTALLEGARALNSAQSTRLYFDGRAPDWALTSTPTVPELTVVDELCQRVSTEPARSVWQFLLAPAGDGKSTALMQAGARLVGSGWRVVWRPHPGVELIPSEFLALPDKSPTLVLVDDADNCIPALRELAGQLDGTRQLHLIAAARLSDWRRTDASLADFENVASIEVQIGALSRREGRELIGAWASIPGGLARLADVHGDESRLTHLLDAVASDRRSQGSLLGGLFRLRYDKTGLDAHVNDLLDSLERHEVVGSHVSLLRAFIYAAALDVAGLEGIDRRLWAELLGVDVGSLRRTVEFSLGAEAATARAGGIVQVRHPELASSAIRLLLARSRGTDLSQIYADIVRSSIELGKIFDLRNYSSTVHLSTRLPDRLTAVGYRRENAFEIALTAARATVDAEPDLLVYQTDLGSLLRKSGAPKAALRLYAAADNRLGTFRDRGRAISGFYFDYGIAFSDAGDPRSSLLAVMTAWGLDASQTGGSAGRHLVQLARGFLRVHEESSSDRSRLALAGIQRVAELAMVGAEDYDWCRRHARSGNAPHAGGLTADQAIELVERGLKSVTGGSSAEQSLGRYRDGSFAARTRGLCGSH
jgi:hypothetical protein